MTRPSDHLTTLTQKKAQLDSFRPLPRELRDNLQEWFNVELTYTSNAIEGNTLSRIETALVIEKGLTVEGKTLREHLEAINHAEALDFIHSLLPSQPHDLSEATILEIHRLILSKIDDVNAGRYRTVPVRIAGSPVIMPNAFKVPDLMTEYIHWINQASDHPVTKAALAHYKLVSIHPFVDGNGRTARLLMNLLLLQAGYPSAIIRKEDRHAYITSLEQAQLGGSLDDYLALMYQAVERSLDIYLDAAQGGSTSEQTEDNQKLLKIGELASATGESVASLRFWTKEGLLSVADTTPGGYQLYDSTMIERVKKIRELQRIKRLTIEEIKDQIR